MQPQQSVNLNWNAVLLMTGVVVLGVVTAVAVFVKNDTISIIGATAIAGLIAGHMNGVSSAHQAT
jgi:hypothetical protein